MLEVYMYEMIVKSNKEKLHEGHLTNVFIMYENITWDSIQRSENLAPE